MAKMKRGKHGITFIKSNCIIGTIIIKDGCFANKKGEIINERYDPMHYFTVQVPSEFKGRVYVLNLMPSQCVDIDKENKCFN